MATTVGASSSSSSSSSNHHSPRGSGFTADGGGGGGVVHSPQFQQRRGLSAPWSEVVRGEPESVPAAVHISPPTSSSSSSLPEKTPFTIDCSSSTKAAAATVTVTVTVAVEAAASMDNPAAEECSDGHNGNAAQPKKPVWNKLPNGVKESGLPVMGAASWPALSECTRASSKSSPPDSSSKPVSNGPISVSQGAVISNAPQKHTNSNPNPTSRHGAPGRQRSMKRGGGGNSGGRPAQSSSVHPLPPPLTPPPPPPPPFPLVKGQGPPANYGNFVQVLPIVPPREPPYPTRPIAGFAPSHAVNDHFSHRNPSRRPRGDGQYHNNPGGRREHDRRNPESNARSSNGRDLHMQHQRAPPRSFMRPPPPVSAAFLSPAPVGPFGFTEMRPSPLYIIPQLHPESFRGMPFIAHAQPQMYIPIPEPPPLPMLLVKQIDYYFSDVNLERDIFLKSSMDEQGWVHISVIAAFPRVMSLTDDIHAILEALRTSTVVEVKDGKVRRRNEWMKYISSTGQGSTTANSQSHSQLGNKEMATTTLQKLTLEEGFSSNQSSTEASLSKCSSVESMDQLHPSNDEGTN